MCKVHHINRYQITGTHGFIRACKAGMEILKSENGSAIDAVAMAIKILEVSHQSYDQKRKGS